MKTLRFLFSAVMLIALLAGMQLTAFTAVVSPADDEVSLIADNEVSRIADNEVSRINNDEIQLADDANHDYNDASLAADEISYPDTAMPTEKDIQPINANPDTGAQDLAIPAVVALLAASTAAIALTSKKKK